VTNEAGVAMTESLTLDFAEWQATGRDQDSTVEAVEYVDATRTILTWAKTQGIDADYDALFKHLGGLSVEDRRATIQAIRHYIKAGFEPSASE